GAALDQARAPAPPSETRSTPYSEPVPETMTRRGLLRGSAAALTALAGGGAAARLLGRSQGQTVMSAQTQTQTQTNQSESTVRAAERVFATISEHWVGDGFRVRSVIAPQGDPRLQSPFLLLDHAARRYFEPTSEQRGVGEHPHRGFETVTFAYRG